MTSSILQRVALGDPGAPAECIDRYGGLVWSLARRLSPGPADAEDATQEIFLDVWRSAARFDPAVASEATFIATIARRRLIDRRRSAQRHQGTRPIEDHAAIANDPPAVERGEEAAAAARALAQLPPEQQRVIQLSIHAGLSHEQIVRATGLPLGTVKTHIRRGLMRVRDSLSSRPSLAAGGRP